MHNTVDCGMYYFDRTVAGKQTQTVCDAESHIEYYYGGLDLTRNDIFFFFIYSVHFH